MVVANPCAVLRFWETESLVGSCWVLYVSYRCPLSALLGALLRILAVYSYSPGRIHAVTVEANRTMARAVVAAVGDMAPSRTSPDPREATTTTATARMESVCSLISAGR